MTDLIDRADSGDIHRFDDLGEGPTEDLRHHMNRRDTGEPTQRIDPRLIQAPTFEAIPRRTIELDDTVIYRGSRVIGVGDLEGPQKPPPPLPKPKDPAETGVNIFGGLGADLPDPEPEPDEDGDDVVFRRGCGGQPIPGRSDAPAGSRVKCRRNVKEAFRRGVLIGAGAALAIYSGLFLAAVAVIR